MKLIVPLLLGLMMAACPALAARPEFRVEVFSGSRVVSLTIQAAEQDVELCGAKPDGACLVLKPGQKAVCSAGPVIRCQDEGAKRSYALLDVSSVGSFRLAPSPAGATAAPKMFQAHNGSITSIGGALRVITDVDLESYISGVLSGEAATLQTHAARAAMAILARTWALRWQGRHHAQGFDFCSLTHCQAFRLPPAGGTSTGQDIDAAALATRGQVLKYRGALADPYFTACCGGMTEAAQNVWPDRAQPYLQAVRDPYCLASAQASWQRELSAERVQQVLALQMPIVAPLRELSVEKRDSSGRVVILGIVAGSAWHLDANGFRYAFDRQWGWGQIKSNLYSVQRRGDSWVVTGHGLGHGVGLCQAGAEQMGRLGFTAERILSVYLPGTEVASQPDDDPIASSDHFELVYPSAQEPWVKQTLSTLEAWRQKLGAHAEVLPPRVRVETWDRMEEFVRATGQPGWTAAASEGESIALQPLAVLARKRILNQALKHELTHLVVHKLGAKGVPRWYEEGLVLYLSEERIENSPLTEKAGHELEATISQPRSEQEMKAAYAEALERVRQLARREGEGALWRVLERPSAVDLRWLQGP